MYVTVNIELDCNDGQLHEFQFGADAVPINDDGTYWGVDEPDVSAPDCLVSTSRLADHDFIVGPWADLVEERLLEAALDATYGHGDDDCNEHMWPRYKEDE